METTDIRDISTEAYNVYESFFYDAMNLLDGGIVREAAVRLIQASIYAEGRGHWSSEHMPRNFATGEPITDPRPDPRFSYAHAHPWVYRTVANALMAKRPWGWKGELGWILRLANEAEQQWAEADEHYNCRCGTCTRSILYPHFFDKGVIAPIVSAPEQQHPLPWYWPLSGVEEGWAMFSREAVDIANGEPIDEDDDEAVALRRQYRELWAAVKATADQLQAEYDARQQKRREKAASRRKSR